MVGKLIGAGQEIIHPALLLRKGVGLKTKRIPNIGDDTLFKGKVKAHSTIRIVGKREHSIYQGIYIVLVLFLLTLFVIRISQSQEPFTKLKNPISRIGGQGAGWNSSDLGLTKEQTKAFEELQRGYVAEARPLRMELVALRIELRHLIRDPNVPSNVLWDRQKRISELQMKLDNLSFSSQMKARTVFTKEQQERLPKDCLLEMDTDMTFGRTVAGSTAGTGR